MSGVLNRWIQYVPEPHCSTAACITVPAGQNKNSNKYKQKSPTNQPNWTKPNNNRKQGCLALSFGVKPLSAATWKGDGSESLPWAYTVSGLRMKMVLRLPPKDKGCWRFHSTQSLKLYRGWPLAGSLECFFQACHLACMHINMTYTNAYFS